MFVVIFRAKAGIQDEEYSQSVARMRELAFNKYGCLDFIVVTEGKHEIAISYWENEESIKQWKQDAEHSLAQELGRAKWYESYIVQVAEIKRQYEYNP
jgi:heme-degrading monooxygenase HmoA